VVIELATINVRILRSLFFSAYDLVFSLRNTKREDIVFIGFQIWVLGMSLVALLNESIPHILASLATHMIATGWAAFQIQHTAQFREDFNRVITNGACDASLLPHYWDARAKAELPSLALNILGLFISAFLTWKLIKVCFLSSRWLSCLTLDLSSSDGKPLNGSGRHCL
jgi:hypothetical protein